MKIAVTNENNQVFQHFGKCKSFAIFQVKDGAVTGKSILDAGDAGHSALADLLCGQGVDLLICGGIGGGAKDALSRCGIKLAAGIGGDVDAAVASYLAGTLAPDDSFECEHHAHHDHDPSGHSCDCH